MTKTNKSKIVITGARGLLGMELCRVFSAQNEIIGIGLTPALLSPFSVQVKAVDITQSEKIAREIRDISPELVIHAAGYTNVDDCELNPDKAHLVNATGTKNVALACQECNVKLVYISTDYVFDGEKTSPYTEDDIPNPINVYGKSKLEGERYVTALLDKWVIVRTSWLFGKHGKNFVNTILSAAQQKPELHVVNDQVGCPTYSIDLAHEISRLLKTEEYGLYHITNNGSCSWYQFACKIVNWAGYDSVKVHPITSQDLGRPAPRPRNSVLAHKHLEATIGDNMRIWHSALEEYLSKCLFPNNSL